MKGNKGRNGICSLGKRGRGLGTFTVAAWLSAVNHAPVKKIVNPHLFVRLGELHCHLSHHSFFQFTHALIHSAFELPANLAVTRP